MFRTGITKMDGKRISAAYIAILAVIIWFRLFLTGDRDILALNSPHDGFWYVHTAANILLSRPYDEMVSIHLPIYSIWLLFWHLLGVPARLAIDAGWLMASGYLAFSMGQLAKRGWVATVAFVYLAFHPYPLFLFDLSLAETLFAVLYMVTLGGGIELWNCRSSRLSWRYWVALASYVCGFALAFHTRKEGVVLLVPIIVLAGWSWVDRQRCWSANGKRRFTIPLLVGPLLATLLVGTLLAGTNYLRWGVFARDELAAPGYRQVMSALNSIDVGRTPLHISVTTRTRSAAYDQSPTLRELEPFLEGAVGRSWSLHSESATGISGEIANGFFYWALRDAAARAGWHRNARTAEAKYSAVATELDQAFNTGRLKKRPLAVFSFVDPDLTKWIWNVPKSVFEIANLIGSPIASRIELPKETASPSQFNEFVSITGRRRMPPKWGISGWVIVPAGSAVGLGTPGSTLFWNPVAATQRRDVPGGYPFSISSDSLNRPTELHVRTADGKIGFVPLSTLVQGRVAKFTGDVEAMVGIEEISNGDAVLPRLDRWLATVNVQPFHKNWLVLLCILYGWIGKMFGLAAVGCIVTVLARGARKQDQAEVFAVITIAGVAVFTHTIVFGILDASSWNGLQLRYFLPVVPAFACMGVLSVALLLTQLPDSSKGN